MITNLKFKMSQILGLITGPFQEYCMHITSKNVFSFNNFNLLASTEKTKIAIDLWNSDLVSFAMCFLHSLSLASFIDHIRPVICGPVQS